MPRAPGRIAAAAGLRAAPGTLARYPVRLWQLALAVLAGNLAVHALPALPDPGLVLLITVLALAVAARAIGVVAGLPAVAVLAFCWTAHAASEGLAARWPPADDGRDVAISGWIDGLPTRDAGRTVFSLRVVEADTAMPPRRVRLSWYDPAPALAAGQTLDLVARLRTPRGLVNPGGFDYERWLFLEGYDATGYVRGGRIDTARDFGSAQAWLGFRARVVERLAAAIDDPDAAALITALSLGERGGFDDRHWTVLQRTGTSHLVAVSGLHIGLIAALSFVLLFRLALRLPYALARHAHALAALGCIVPAGVYAALAGFALPTRRALLMLVVAQLLIVARRRWPVSSGLGLALTGVLLLDPLASLTASFWLSFGAVGLLLAVAGRPEMPLAPRRRGPMRRLGELGRLQWALTLGLAPLVLRFFGQVSLASLPVNLIAIPLFSLLVVPLSLIAAFAVIIGLESPLLLTLAGRLAGMVWQGLELAAANPLAAFALPRPPLAAVAVAVAAAAMLLPRHRLPRRGLALLGLVPLGLDPGVALAPGEARVTVLDVGHGLAVAIETRSHRVLYDAGPVYRSGFDAGAEIVAPVLAELGGRPLDRLIVSHGDSDHAGGAAAVAAHYPGVRVLGGPDLDDTAACVDGQAWTRDGVRFELLHPPAGFYPLGNESSCVLRIETAGGSLLLTGDIERRAEARLAPRAALAADVVVVPHHGSLTSSSAAFVAAVSPALAIVSAGYNNRWDFPRPEVRERWEAVGATLLVTGDDGAIDLRFGADAITFTAARDRGRRYWQAEREPVSGAIVRSAL